MRNVNVRDKRNDHNKTYKRNHHNLALAFFKTVYHRYGKITGQGIADLAGLSRKTFYEHYTDINHAFYQGVDDLLTDFDTALDDQVWKFSKMFPDSNKRNLYMLMIFLNQQRDIFNLICDDLDHQELLYKMVWKVFKRLELKWLPVGIPAPDVNSERGSMCIRMMVDVISRWGMETHCDIRKADRYIDRLMRITEAAAQNKLP